MTQLSILGGEGIVKRSIHMEQKFEWPTSDKLNRKS